VKEKNSVNKEMDEDRESKRKEEESLIHMDSKKL
jgi:hypothetical protein